jgi:hypothetical protein
VHAWAAWRVYEIDRAPHRQKRIAIFWNLSSISYC